MTCDIPGCMVYGLKLFFFSALQAILAPLQGALNAVVYGWSRKEFRKAINLRQVGGANGDRGAGRRHRGSRYESLTGQSGKTGT